MISPKTKVIAPKQSPAGSDAEQTKMTSAQADELRALKEAAGEAFDPNLSTAAAEAEIERLTQQEDVGKGR